MGSPVVGVLGYLVAALALCPSFVGGSGLPVLPLTQNMVFGKGEGVHPRRGASSPAPNLAYFDFQGTVNSISESTGNVNRKLTKVFYRVSAVALGGTHEQEGRRHLRPLATYRRHPHGDTPTPHAARIHTRTHYIKEGTRTTHTRNAHARTRTKGTPPQMPRERPKQPHTRTNGARVDNYTHRRRKTPQNGDFTPYATRHPNRHRPEGLPTPPQHPPPTTAEGGKGTPPHTPEGATAAPQNEHKPPPQIDHKRLFVFSITIYYIPPKPIHILL